jgi:hypothetical protein
MGFNLDDYEPVAARHARWLADHPTGRTVTHLLSAPGADVCVIRAELWVDDQLMATGLAEEIRGQGNVNRTSHVENCEASAVGRALANAGYAGSDVSKRPSREEMAKVQRMTTRVDDARPNTTIREPAGVASEKQVNYAKSLLKAQGHDVPAHIASMSKGDISSLIEHLKNGTYTPPVNDEEPF